MKSYPKFVEVDHKAIKVPETDIKKIEFNALPVPTIQIPNLTPFDLKNNSFI